MTTFVPQIWLIIAAEKSKNRPEIAFIYDRFHLIIRTECKNKSKIDGKSMMTPTVAPNVIQM